MIRAKLFREARNLGFTQVKRYHSELKGKVVRDTYVFECMRGTRYLILSIDKDGAGEVYHGTVSGWGNRADNPGGATSFKDLSTMYRAIAFEHQRITTAKPVEVVQAKPETEGTAAAPWKAPE